MFRQTKLVSDNGSNFVKAFSEFGISRDDNSDDDDDGTVSGSGTSEAENDVFFADVTSILFETPEVTGNDDRNAIDDDNFFLRISLPRHHRCSSHTLSLIGTNDVSKVLKDYPAYGRIHRAATAKCSAIWNKTSRSPKACEQYEEVMGSQPLSLCPSRWNSLYDSVVRIPKGQEKLKELCVALEVAPFKDHEIKFLFEFVTYMQPIAESLDRLQKEKNCFMGELIPTLLRTVGRLGALDNMNLAHCTQLRNSWCRACSNVLNIFYYWMIQFPTTLWQALSIRTFALGGYLRQDRACAWQTAA